jgi:hypothetical protein
MGKVIFFGLLMMEIFLFFSLVAHIKTAAPLLNTAVVAVDLVIVPCLMWLIREITPKR